MTNENKQQINLGIDHSKEVFYTNDFGVIASKNNEITLDFRQTLPRIDALPNGQVVRSMQVKHNPILIQPTLLKMLVIILKEELEKIEKEQGEIKLPEKWKMEKDKDKTITTRVETPDYIG